MDGGSEEEGEREGGREGERVGGWEGGRRRRKEGRVIVI